MRKHQSKRALRRGLAAVLALVLCLSGLFAVAPAALASEAAATGEKTEWQIRFAEHFTDEVVITDHSYSSPNVSIDITTHQEIIDGYQQVWYVADIYIASIDCFRCFARGNSFDHYVKVQADELAQEANALLAINGDYCNAQVQSGFYVRNGQVYDTHQTVVDICVLYSDGTMETYGKKDYKVDEVLEREPYQVWKFGPRFLTKEGGVKKEFNAAGGLWIGNPRSAIGYYEPGHYCFVMVDGRQKNWSRGLTLEQMSQLFADLGCKCAYNLDGGASATMTFMGQLFNKQSSYRKIGDILMIGEPDGSWPIPKEGE